MTAPMSKPLSTFDRIADFALDRAPGEIPASTLEAAALMTLDTLGIIAAAGPMEAGVIARACAGDIDRLCAGVPPGEGRIKACMKAHISQVSAPCFDALLKAIAAEREPE